MDLLAQNQLINRRTALGYGLGAAAAVALTGCGSGSSGASSTANKNTLKPWLKAGIDWKQYDGTTLEFMIEKHPWVTAIRKDLLSTFTELTGINIKLIPLGEEALMAKLPVQLKSGSSTPDVMLVPSYQQWANNHWLADLRPYIDNSKLTDKAFYDSDDMFQVARSFVGWDEAKIYGVPITSEVQTIFYRSDLVDSDMSTYDALYKTAKAAKKDGRAGLVSRGSTGSTMAWDCEGFVFGNDGMILNPAGKPTLDSKETIEGTEYFATLLQDAGPVGPASWGWQQANQAFMSDKAAIIIDSSVWAPNYYNPEQNPDAKKVMAAAFPTKGSIPLSPNYWHWVVSANANSKNREAAWLFLQWATCPETSRQLGKQAVVVPRRSVWKSTGFQHAYGEQAAKVILDMYDHGRIKPYTSLYTSPKWPTVGTEFATAMSSTIAGESDAATALRKAQAKLRRG